MDLGIRLEDIVFSMDAFLFPFWPFIVLSPVLSRRNVVVKMLVVWAAMLLVRITLLFSPLPTVDFLIREPANSTLFLIAGGAIVFVLMLRALRRWA